MRLPLELLLLPFITTTLLPERALADLEPYRQSAAYDEGKLGPFPHQSFISAPKHAAPRLNHAVPHPRPRANKGLFTLLGLQGSKVGAEARGPLLLDARGGVAWFGGDRWPNAHNVQVQEYKVAQYLTFWAGAEGERAHGSGYYYMLDSTYKEVLRVSTKGDPHEFLITKQGTAVFILYEKKKVDLSSVDPSRGSGWIWDCLFQEVELSSKRFRFRWRASDVFGLDSSYAPLNKQGSYDDPWDWFHLNSVDKDEEGNYLLSARYTHAVTYISGKDGSVVWSLGGKRNDFKDLSDGGATNFKFQHDARWRGADEISLFDNGADPSHRDGVSRGMLISIDTKSPQKTATLKQQFIHPDRIGSISDGNMQIIDNGNVLVGWGVAGAWTEFAPNGSVIEDVHFQPATQFQTGNAYSYRTFKMRWQGFPQTSPTLVIKGNAAHVSWNGATEIHHWRLECVHKSWFVQESDWSTVVSEERQGFETMLDFNSENLKKYVRAVAFNSAGDVLGTTRTVDWRFARKPLAQAYAISDRDSLIWYICIVLLVALVLLRVSRRCARRFFVWRGSKKYYNALMARIIPTTKLPP